MAEMSLHWSPVTSPASAAFSRIPSSLSSEGVVSAALVVVAICCVLLLVVFRQRHVAVEAGPADAADERQDILFCRYRFCRALVGLRQGLRHPERHQVFGVCPLDMDGHVAFDALPFAVGAGLQVGEGNAR